MHILKAKTLGEAYEARTGNADALYLSGGSEVLRKGGRAGEETLVIDLTDLLSGGISKEGDMLVVGALASFQDLIEAPDAPSWLRKAAHGMASLSLRMQATVGGQIASLRDDSYLIPALLAAGSRVRVWGKEGGHELMLLDYVRRGGCDCIITHVIIPCTAKVALKRIARSSSSHSALSIALASDGSCHAAVKGSGYAHSRGALETMEYVDDITGSAAYKRYIALECSDILAKEVDA